MPAGRPKAEVVRDQITVRLLPETLTALKERAGDEPPARFLARLVEKAFAPKAPDLQPVPTKAPTRTRATAPGQRTVRQVVAESRGADGCPHPKDRENKLGYGVFCLDCTARLR